VNSDNSQPIKIALFIIFGLYAAWRFENLIDIVKVCQEEFLLGHQSILKELVLP